MINHYKTILMSPKTVAHHYKSIWKQFRMSIAIRFSELW